MYLALSRVEFRYNVQIVQIMSDHGSQLRPHLLGECKEYYQKRLGARWGVFNNLAYSQHRNMCERKVQSAKRVIKQALCGVPGPVHAPMTWSMLDTVLVMCANMTNRCPYLHEDNTELLCPADLISPWNASEPTVRELPTSNLKSLEYTRKLLLVKRAEILKLQREELSDELRYKAGKMKLGVNKQSPSVGLGCVVMLQLSKLESPELGVVTSLDRGECTVRLRNRSLKTTVAVLTPVTLPQRSEKEISAMSTNITHFISFEISSDKSAERLAKLQAQLQAIESIGSPMKIPHIHLTLAVLSVKPEELGNVCIKTEKAIERFRDLLAGNEGFLLTASMVRFLDHGALALGVDIGKELCGMARHLIEEELGEFIADKSFSPHITLFSNNSMEARERQQLKESLSVFKSGTLICDKITLRSKKTEQGPSVEILSCDLKRAE